MATKDRGRFSKDRGRFSVFGEETIPMFAGFSSKDREPSPVFALSLVSCLYRLHCPNSHLPVFYRVDVVPLILFRASRRPGIDPEYYGARFFRNIGKFRIRVVLPDRLEL